jgi:hypothetical protein
VVGVLYGGVGMSEPSSVAKAISLLPLVLIFGSVAYYMLDGVEDVPPLKYRYTIKTEGMPTLAEGSFDTLELCEQDWANTSVSLTNGRDRGLGHYELTGCAPV